MYTFHLERRCRAFLSDMNVNCVGLTKALRSTGMMNSFMEAMNT